MARGHQSFVFSKTDNVANLPGELYNKYFLHVCMLNKILSTYVFWLYGRCACLVEGMLMRQAQQK